MVGSVALVPQLAGRFVESAIGRLAEGFTTGKLSFPCRETPCTGLGPSCPFAPRQHPIWLFLVAAAVSGFLILAALTAVFAYWNCGWGGWHHPGVPGWHQTVERSASSALRAVLLDHDTAHPDPALQQQGFAAAAAAGGATLLSVNGQLYCCGYTAPVVPAAASPAFPPAATTRNTRAALGAVHEALLQLHRAVLDGATAASTSCSMYLRRLLQLNSRPVTAAVHGVKWAWLAVSLATSLFTFITLASQTWRNFYRLDGSWLMFWALLSGWASWVTTSWRYFLASGTLNLLGSSSAGGVLDAVFSASGFMYAFGMLSTVIAPCNAPKPLASAVDVVAFLQLFILPAAVVHWSASCIPWLVAAAIHVRAFLQENLPAVGRTHVPATLAPMVAVGQVAPVPVPVTQELWKATWPLTLLDFPEEAALLQAGFRRASAKLLLPGEGRNSSWQVVEHRVYEPRNRFRQLVCGAWVLHTVVWLMDAYFSVLRLLCVVVGACVLTLSSWYTLVALAPALVGGVLLFL